jgi:enamine deaminase RidA (YjgF/YER057c/UK114 family)
MADPATIAISVPQGADAPAAAFDALEAAARGAGFELADLARLRIFYVDRDQIPGFNAVRSARYEAAFPAGGYPATTGVMVGTDSTGAGLRMEALLSGERESFNSERVPYTFGGHGKPAFSHRVARADLACLSGQTALDMEGELPEGGAAAQAAAAAANALAVLVDSGDGPADVLRVMLYVVGAEHAATAAGEVAATYGEGVDVTVILVDDLFKPGVLVEVETLVVPHGAPAGWASAAYSTTLPGPDPEAALDFAVAEIEAGGTRLADVAALTFWCGDRDLTAPLTRAAALRDPFPTTMAVPFGGADPRELTVEVVSRPS